MPVVIGQLHSQLAPAAAAIKRATRQHARVAYMMTDSAALPLAFSRRIAELRDKGLRGRDDHRRARRSAARSRP